MDEPMKSAVVGDIETARRKLTCWPAPTPQNMFQQDPASNTLAGTGMIGFWRR